MKWLFSLFLLNATLFINCLGIEMRWDWQRINTSKITFPSSFSWGVALCEYQNSGADRCPNTNWAQWEYSHDSKGNPRIAGDQKSQGACNFYDKWRDDIQLLKELKVDSLRLSVEWSLIEPQCGAFDEKVIEHYRQICQTLLKEGITPLITLHHFTDPLWFTHIGAFEVEENSFYFVRFCKRIFTELADLVPLWVTFNEPGVYVFQGYLRGVFPPGEVFNINLAAQVLKNMLKAHVKAYKALKVLPEGKKVQIGIVHQLVQFEPYNEKNPLEKIVSGYMNSFMHQVIFDFLKTGEYRFVKPFQHYEKIEEAPYCYDFIGLNYYSHMLVTSQWPEIIKHESGYREGDIPTDMPYGIYAEGLYRAIKSVSELEVPIYITECGISDKKDDRRELFLKRYLYALSCAIEDGYDVRGFYYWSLMDNFEWDMGYDQKFGLYEIDFETQKRTLRNGSRYYIDVIEKSKE
ncbi:MAG: family 1 glycosylhydrolase [Candidatus Babeliaceae bacterium]